VDRFARNFITVSIVYLFAASVLGVYMLSGTYPPSLKFVHSHLMLLGWVSMMIYGVGYHILPRFMGKLLKNKSLAEVQFWLANAGLLAFYMAGNAPVSVAFGVLEVISIGLFLYNMMGVILSKTG
jgi:cbb3-type cytochrome oxidase subunit 1